MYCGEDLFTTLNPQLTFDNQSVNHLGAQIYERLLDIDPNSHHPLPALARSWDVSPDGLAYTFYLREGVAFHQSPDFSPSRYLNANDVVFTFNRILDLNHPYHRISGGRYPWFESLGFERIVSEVIAESSHAVTFILYRTDNAFLSMLATAPAVILSEEYGEYLLREQKQEFLDTRPIGTGPFRFREFQEHSHVRLTRHWDYWQGASIMEQVVFDLSTKGVGRLAKLLTGECDIIDSPPDSQISIIHDDPRLELRRQSGLNLAYLAINNRSQVLQDPLLRKAIMTAIDKQKLVDTVYHGGGHTTDSVLPPASWAYDARQARVGYNPVIAKAYLKNSGYNGQTPIRLAFLSNEASFNPRAHKSAELIQADLEAVGLEIELIRINANDNFVLESGFSYDLLLTGWRATNGDPDSFLRPILSCDAISVGSNSAQWCNLQFDNLLELALKTNQEKQRMRYYRLAQEVIDVETPVIPLLHSHHYQAHHRSIGGLQLSPFGTRSFATVYRSE
ncbi:ABC transporter substrate-binding protein [Thaumasiovibrio subtropicus]|uniref:ABC transporter substrate-binding protein n=1 Tax=Thaumasiovibrio subtropicus TaxID=1891207 RepID=UPI001FE7CA7B|nr:ABC transporter substrate-binding protein [Thaumasiovibrio subtropicus]